jgi:hypothetical protein
MKNRQGISSSLGFASRGNSQTLKDFITPLFKIEDLFDGLTYHFDRQLFFTN